MLVTTNILIINGTANYFDNKHANGIIKSLIDT